MKPLQVWLPNLDCRVNERDLQRAFHGWQGQLTIWLLPEIKETVRWREEHLYPLLAIPAECLEKIDVYHISDNGFVFGPGADKHFPHCRVDGLLDAWLNCEDYELVRAPKGVELHVPAFSDKVAYRTVQISVGPKGFLPIESFDESGRFTALWSPDFKTVSPDAESTARYGPFKIAELDGLPVAESQKDGSKSWFLACRWPEPLRALIPQSAGMDLILAQQKMKQIVKVSRTNARKAIQLAKDAARFSVSDGHTSRELGCFWPKFEQGEDAVNSWAEDLGLKPAPIEELSKNDRFMKILASRMEIRRAVGVEGLFWALLIERLEKFNRSGSCNNCGRLIQGRKQKIYCGPQDNRDCYLETQATRKRRSRERLTSDPIS